MKKDVRGQKGGEEVSGISSGKIHTCVHENRQIVPVRRVARTYNHCDYLVLGIDYRFLHNGTYLRHPQYIVIGIASFARSLAPSLDLLPSPYRASLSSLILISGCREKNLSLFVRLETFSS